MLCSQVLLEMARHSVSWFINSIGYTVFMFDYYFSALQYIVRLFSYKAFLITSVAKYPNNLVIKILSGSASKTTIVLITYFSTNK